jgi:hypothetical protein
LCRRWPGRPNEGLELEIKKPGRVGARPCQHTLYPEKGGELMEIYILEVEVLEEKLAPIGGSAGGN